MNQLKTTSITFSFEGMDRLFRAHGHTLHDIVLLRAGHFHRIPDVVVWPGITKKCIKPKVCFFLAKICISFSECHKDVEQIIALATACNVVIIPFGGGTNVTCALELSPEEKRMIVSLDTSQMVYFSQLILRQNRKNLYSILQSQILWIDDGNLIAHIEAGIIGKDLEDRLQAKGYTTGHEPDSYEFSRYSLISIIKYRLDLRFAFQHVNLFICS